jgi:transcriptional regulator with XRE-family HTH domain
MPRKFYDDLKGKVVMDKNRDPLNVTFLLHLGDAIRHRRINLYLTQEELGSRSHLSRTYITAVENGLRNISMITLLRIARALKSRPSSHILVAEKAHNDKGEKKNEFN